MNGGRDNAMRGGMGYTRTHGKSCSNNHSRIIRLVPAMSALQELTELPVRMTNQSEN